jgi:hypothetical protein
MKMRDGFVSNSSSSSFIISKYHLSKGQIDKIYNHAVIGRDLGIPHTDWAWSITETDENIKGSTVMDNFDMHRFLNEIGINGDLIEWSY